MSMRTTISLDDDIIADIKAYAQQRDVALGKAVSDLVRRGLHAPLQTRLRNGLQVVELPSGSPKVSSATVKKLEADLE